MSFGFRRAFRLEIEILILYLFKFSVAIRIIVEILDSYGFGELLKIYKAKICSNNSSILSY